MRPCRLASQHVEQDDHDDCRLGRSIVLLGVVDRPLPEQQFFATVMAQEDLIMTTERPNKDNPATDPENRQNGQGDHHGKPHSPEEFDVMNPAKPGEYKQENQ